MVGAIEVISAHQSGGAAVNGCITIEFPELFFGVGESRTKLKPGLAFFCSSAKYFGGRI